MLARKFTNYRLHMAEITKTSRNALFSLWSLKAGKNFNFNQIRSKWRKNYIKK